MQARVSISEGTLGLCSLCRAPLTRLVMSRSASSADEKLFCLAAEEQRNRERDRGQKVQQQKA
jgi:hypothetical protein